VRLALTRRRTLALGVVLCVIVALVAATAHVVSAPIVPDVVYLRVAPRWSGRLTADVKILDVRDGSLDGRTLESLGWDPVIDERDGKICVSLFDKRDSWRAWLHRVLGMEEVMIDERASFSPVNRVDGDGETEFVCRAAPGWAR
jgi:hypothetical protein